MKKQRINHDEIYEDLIERAPNSQSKYALSDRLIGTVKYTLYKLNIPGIILEGIAELSGFPQHKTREDYLKRAKETRLAKELRRKRENYYGPAS